MKKVYLMKGMAALTLGLVVASCNKMNFDGNNTVTPEQAKANAEAQLGVTIDPNQDWNMTGEVEASVAVNGFQGATYTVTIYDANPLTGEAVTAYGSKTVQSGQTANFKFIAPKGLVSVYAGLKDAKGYTYVKPTVIVNGKLETAFGGASAASAPAFRAAAHRGAADDFVVAVREMPDLSAYIDDAVAISDDNNTTNPANTVHHYLIPEGTTWSKNIPLIQSGSGISVYVQGTLNINAEQRVNGGCVFIVGPKGTVNIASGTQLVTNANNNANTVGSFYVYPDGKVQGEGTLQFANGTSSYNYNGGTIDVGTINNNGGTLYNAGTIEADNMQGGAGFSIYENAGKVHIGQAAKGSSTANTRIHNNCWWECDGTLSCRNIQQGEGAYIKAGNLEMSGSEDGSGDAAYIWAKANSLIDVPGAVAFNGVDIVGPTTENEYAYLQFGYAETSYGAHGLTTAMNYATAWVDGKEVVTSGAIINNIRLSVDHFDTNFNKYNNRANPYQCLLDMLNGEFAASYQYDIDTSGEWASFKKWPTIGNGNAQLVAKGQVDELVTEDECSPGIQIVPPTPIIENGPVYSYAFEDTWQGDYDMNDVVLKVRQEKETTNNVVTSDKIIVKLVASGATLDLNIRLYDYSATGEKGYGESFTVLSKNGYDEVHDLFGVDKKTMVNTGNGATAAAVTFELNNSDGKYNNADGVFDPAKLRFAIYSAEQGEVRLAGNGESPFGIIIPENWKWPIERVNITNAYKKLDADAEGEGNEDQSFASFAETVGSALNWFKYPTGQVYTTTVQEDF